MRDTLVALGTLSKGFALLIRFFIRLLVFLEDNDRISLGIENLVHLFFDFLVLLTVNEYSELSLLKKVGQPRNQKCLYSLTKDHFQYLQCV